MLWRLQAYYFITSVVVLMVVKQNRYIPYYSCINSIEVYPVQVWVCQTILGIAVLLQAVPVLFWIRTYSADLQDFIFLKFNINYKWKIY